MIQLSGVMAGLVAGMAIGGAGAQELPKTMAVTAYDVGSSSYAQAVAVGAAFKQNLGVTLRVLPGKNDISRMVPLRDGKVDFSFNGIGIYYAMEGVDVFAARDWGPQDIRMMMAANGDNCLPQFVTATSGVKTLADLKGKRIVQVKGSAALNLNTLAHLRYANLGWDDVKLVVVGGNNSAFDAMVEGQADSFVSTSNSANLLRLATSPAGLFFPPVPHADKEGWARMRAVAPYYTPVMCKDAAGNPPAFEAAAYPYPILMSYATLRPDLATAMTKAMFAQFPNFKDSAPATSGYALERQVFNWVVPFHPGAVAFYKEAGKWTADAQANQDKTSNRMDVLLKTWKAFLATKPSEDGFKDAWMAARFKGLKAAGLDPIWETL